MLIVTTTTPPQRILNLNNYYCNKTKNKRNDLKNVDDTKQEDNIKQDLVFSVKLQFR